MLLYVASCCWELLRKVWNRSKNWANNSPSQYFFPKSSATMLDPFSHLFKHCFCWPRMRITQGYTPFRDHTTMHCRSQQCWELLCPFASTFKKFHNSLCMQFTRNLWVTYDVCIRIEIGQIQVICFFCLNMQHLRAVTGFAHRSLGSTFQQSLNQREIVLKLIARQ